MKGRIRTWLTKVFSNLTYLDKVCVHKMNNEKQFFVVQTRSITFANTTSGKYVKELFQKAEKAFQGMTS